MSLSNEERNNLIKNRIDNANEILEEATALLDLKMLKGTSNRIYYALFNIVHGLALKDEFICKTHNGLQVYFNKEYLKTKTIKNKIGVIFNDAVEMRTTGDYQIAPNLNYDDVSILLTQAKELRDIIVKILNNWMQKNV